MRRGVLLATLSVLALSASLAVAPIAHAGFPGQNGRIAYVTISGDHKVIESVDARGGDRQPLIDLGTGRDAIDPAWSWDGLKIAFAGRESPGGPFVIYTANADGTGTPQQVTTPGGSGWLSDTDPAWMPTGGFIAFVRTFADGTSGIWLVNLASGSIGGGSMFNLDVKELAWSPDAGRVAFSARQHTCPERPCRWGILIWNVFSGDVTNGVRDPYFGDYDWHHPDWSPDGTMLVARFGKDEAPADVSGVRVFDLSSGNVLDGPLTPCGIMTEPSFSPDGRWVLVTATPTADPGTGELGEPNLCAIRTDSTEAYLLDGTGPRSDAAWGAVPGSEPPPPSEIPPPPPPDTSPPSIEFRPEPSSTEWLATNDGTVFVLATDDRSWPSITCFDNGSWLPLASWTTWRVGSSVKGVATLPEGRNDLECTARDGAGNSITASATYLIDLPPTIESVTVSPTVARAGSEVSISAVVTDAGSGVRSVDFAVSGATSGAVASGAMSRSGSTFTGSFVPSSPDLFAVSVSASDESGLVAKSRVSFVSYDPSAGSVNGTGWIVPGGPTSDSTDNLPGLDGVTKASFAFSARYRTASSVTPSGSLTFSYSNRFKLQSKQLSWLAVANARTAYLGGVASIQGRYGDFPFVAAIVDGASTGGRDRFELSVFGPGATIDSPTLCSASGDVGGQIQIQT